MESNKKHLWTCPKCGHQFVSRNLWHSCGRYDLDSHFSNQSASVRDTFDRHVQAANSCGPATIYARKTRIVFMVRVRFANVITRKNWLYFSLWLTRKIQHPRLHKVEVYGPRSYVHQFRLAGPEEIDRHLESLICEAYRVGRQEHLLGR